MNKEIKYIGFYDFPDAKMKRAANLAAMNKMDYIADAIVRAGYNVHFLSPSWFDDTSSSASFHWQSTVKVNNHKKVTFCPSFGTKIKWARNLKIILSLLWMFFYLLFHTKKNEKVLMYHVPWLSISVRWAKRIRGFELILEVEEIYGDVSVIHPYFHVLEKKLINSANAYLFSTELLINRIGTKKPFIVIYGAYKTYPQLAVPPEDGRIHLLYAGIIDLHKAGAFNALEAAKFLPEKYILHIIGFGEVKLLKEKITEVNALKGCQIVYEGILSGDEYIKYCQKCHIGLSTQNIEGEYLKSSFPSKIISYLTMGLNVVSGTIDCVQHSKIGQIVNYYSESTPESISKAIKETKIGSSQSNINIIAELNTRFEKEIKKILE